jgi:hypothetical protein
MVTELKLEGGGEKQRGNRSWIVVGGPAANTKGRTTKSQAKMNFNQSENKKGVHVGG